MATDRPLRSNAFGFATGAGVAAVAWFALFAAQFGMPTWNARWATALYAQKETLAKVPDPPRVLVVGGSSPLFAVRAADISAALGVPALNFGTHAGLDLDYILGKAASVARAGDLVVLALEYDYYRRAPARMNAFMLDHAVASDVAYFHRLPAHRKAFAVLQMDIVRITGPWREHGDPRRPGPFEPYGNEILNEHGDMLGANPVLKTADTRRRLETQRRMRIGIHDDARPVLSEFVERARARGISVVAVPPALMQEPLHATARFADMVSTAERWHREIGAPYLLSPRSAFYPRDWFFDTRYHLDGAAARLHTLRVVEALRAHVPSPAAPPAPRTPPSHPLAILEAAFGGWEPISGFGRVEGPYPQWNLGPVIWALGHESRLAVRTAEATPVTVRASVRAAAAGQRLEVHAAGAKVYERTFQQATDFEEINFRLGPAAGAAHLQLVHIGNPLPAGGPHHALLFRSLRLDSSR